MAAVGHQGGRGPLSCVWGVAGPTWAARNRRWQGDCCLPPDSVCSCVCVWGGFACSNVLSWATPGPGGPVSQIVSCGCLAFLQQEHILADLIRRVKHSGSGLKCVVDMLSGNEAYFLIFFSRFISCNYTRPARSLLCPSKCNLSLLLCAFCNLERLGFPMPAYELRWFPSWKRPFTLLQHHLLTCLLPWLILLSYTRITITQK